MSTHPNSIPLRHGQTRRDLPNGTTVVSGRCMVTGKPHSILIPTEGLDAWLLGALIQVALPTVAMQNREFLLTGFSPAGWSKVFGDQEG
jgi:hypothetical protein